jgi:hypothetical protein
METMALPRSWRQWRRLLTDTALFDVPHHALVRSCSKVDAPGKPISRNCKLCRDVLVIRSGSDGIAQEEEMQDELSKPVADKAGITEEQAGTSVAAVMGFLKERLPEPLGTQLRAEIRPTQVTHRFETRPQAG